ncbi:MAG: O-antigen ligase family protein, partial [Lacipirellulaceae bacterium]
MIPHPVKLIRYGSIFLLVAAHLQAVMPMLAPISMVLFVVVHAPALRFYRQIPAAVQVAAIFVVYTFGLLFLHNMLGDYRVLDFLRANGRVVYMLCLFLFVSHLKPSVDIERPLFYSLIIVTAGIAALALYSRFVSVITVGEMPLSTKRSITGFFENHNTMSGLLGAVLALGGASWLHRLEGRTPNFINRFSLAIGFFLLIAFASSLSRSYTLGLLATGLLLIWRVPDPRVRKNCLIGGGFAGVILAGYVLVNRSEQIDSDNISNRGVLYTRAVGLIRQSPIIGIGPGGFEEIHAVRKPIVPGLITLRHSGTASEERYHHSREGIYGAHVHNTYLQLLCDVGFVGAFLLAAVFWLAFRDYRRLASIDSEEPYEEVPDESDDQVEIPPWYQSYEHAAWNSKATWSTLAFLAVAGVFVNWCF